MALDSELDEFRALSLILQHRALGRELERIAAALESCQTAETPGHDTAELLLPMLRGFTLALPEHFAAESRSTASLLRDVGDPEFERRLRQLDGEHPQLLVRFQIVVQQLTSHHAPAANAPPLASLERVISNLATAIEAFLRHEAEEDALFAD